ncbi:hypothetical protein C8R46DRAFT_1224540 [Mycena filopes]|nr:hypothetical protein C8R46DRAFT_1224540 [Mycena filopes]
MGPPTPSMASTYGSWLISLFLETILYGIGITQAFLYYQWWPKDPGSIKFAVLVVMILETIQLCFFFRSTYFRFVQRFGMLQEDLVWSDSLQLFANYVSAFAVQIFFAHRVYILTREHGKFFKASLIGIYAVGILAVLQLSAGTAQTVMSYKLRSFAKLDQTTAITTLQTAASVLCDVVITIHLCFYLARSRSGLATTERMLRALAINAVNRGMLTAITSILTMILFLVSPHTFWFFLSIAPNSKLYMNSMLATLNMRGHIWRKYNPNGDRETINVGDIGPHEFNANRGHSTVSRVEFVTTPGTVDGSDISSVTTKNYDPTTTIEYIVPDHMSSTKGAASGTAAKTLSLGKRKHTDLDFHHGPEDALPSSVMSSTSSDEDVSSGNAAKTLSLGKRKHTALDFHHSSEDTFPSSGSRALRPLPRRGRSRKTAAPLEGLTDATATAVAQERVRSPIEIELVQDGESGAARSEGEGPLIATTVVSRDDSTSTAAPPSKRLRLSTTSSACDSSGRAGSANALPPSRDDDSLAPITTVLSCGHCGSAVLATSTRGLTPNVDLSSWYNACKLATIQ